MKLRGNLRQVNRSFSVLLLGLLTSGLAVAIAGCGNSKPLMIPGGGNVTLGGDSVEDFAITFVPGAGVASASSTTMIKSGKYEFTTTNGPAKPGPYRVVIQEPVIPVSRPDRMKGVMPIKERSWNFDFDVPDKGPFSKDFELK